MRVVALGRYGVVRPRPRLLRDLLLLAVVASVLAADQLSKQLVHRYMALGESVPAEGFLRLTYVTNTGGAFGLFTDQTLFLTGASFVGIGVLLLFYRTHPWPGRLVRLSLGLLLGGAVGNLIDRLRSGEVIDFIDVGWWPVFNLADSSIVLGITLLIGLFLLADTRDRAPLPAPTVLFSSAWAHQDMPPAHADPSERPPSEVGC